MDWREGDLERVNLLWAKVNPSSPNDYHPLLWHLLDAAAVSRAMWEDVTCDAARLTVSAGLGVSVEKAGSAISTITALHDIGKATPFFQGLSVGRMEALREAGFSEAGSDPKPPFRHGLATAAVLRQLLMKGQVLGALPLSTAKLVLYSAGAHHGIFPRTDRIVQFSSRWLGDRAWDSARKAIVQTVADIVGNDLTDCVVGPTCAGMVQAFVSGFISVSDWIASCEDFFPYHTDEIDPSDYYDLSIQKAHNVFRELKWARLTPGDPNMGFRDAFRGIGVPYPLQLESERLGHQICGPCLVMIEAPMGEGKTEAALFIQKMLVERAGASGSFIAMPTMATANQIFERVRKFLVENGDKGTALNLHLLHGQAVLSRQYKLMRQGATLDDDPDSRVVAEEWFTYKKRGLLAPYGVGTIDQVLLGVLPTKHFFVRLSGLAGKAVVFDEVHAYDTYTSDLLIETVRWLRAMGSSVILMSATLPESKRKELVDAWAGKSTPLEASSYPRITVAYADDIETRCFESSRGTDAMRSGGVEIEWADFDINAITKILVNRLSSGGSAAVICNTVRRAQEAYRGLRERLGVSGVSVSLFHARYPFEERESRENECLKDFGKAHAEHDKGKVLVATQVIEQSLDLDFDLMISELAPVDLLLQRIGRLHRHMRSSRPSPVRTPRIIVLNPGSDENGVPDFGSSEKVYERAVLLRTFGALHGRQEIRLPEEIYDLVKAVYDGPLTLPDEWMTSYTKAVGDMSDRNARDEYKARAATISSPSSSEIWESAVIELDESEESHPTVRAMTRLSMPSVKLICLFSDGAGVYFDRGMGDRVVPRSVDNEAYLAKLLGRTVATDDQRVVRALRDSNDEQGIADRVLRGSKVLTFERTATSGEWVHELGGVRVILDDDLGLMIESSGDA